MDPLEAECPSQADDFNGIDEDATGQSGAEQPAFLTRLDTVQISGSEQLWSEIMQGEDFVHQSVSPPLGGTLMACFQYQGRGIPLAYDFEE